MTVRQRSLLLTSGLMLMLPRAEATVEMQNQAKKLGFAVQNCLYCHASPHATATMQAKARALNIPAGDCLACHGNTIPAKLNARGEWLVAQKAARRAKAFDMVWLKEYKEATPEPKAKPTPKDVIAVQHQP